MKIRHILTAGLVGRGASILSGLSRASRITVVIVLALAIAASSLGFQGTAKASTTACYGNPFPDVSSSSIFCAVIIWGVDNGITTGYTDGTFRPTQAVTRQEMAAFLFRMQSYGSSAPRCQTSRFVDVSTSSLFCGYINWMVDNGITTGYTDGTFRPTQAVTRQETAAFLYRLWNGGAAERPSCIGGSNFIDVSASSQFCGYINWMANNHITAGYTDGTFRPTQAVSRQEAMMFLYRYTQVL